MLRRGPALHVRADHGKFGEGQRSADSGDRGQADAVPRALHQLVGRSGAPVSRAERSLPPAFRIPLVFRGIRALGELRDERGDHQVDALDRTRQKPISQKSSF